MVQYLVEEHTEPYVMAFKTRICRDAARAALGIDVSSEQVHWILTFNQSEPLPSMKRFSKIAWQVSEIETKKEQIAL